jgi:superfamily II DNA/RNA helicase
VEALIAKTRTDRQSLLFSATMPSAIVALAKSHMHQPVHVRAEGHDAQMTVPDTTQFVYQTHDLDKPEILGKLLQVPTLGKMMVFTHTKRAAQRVADDLVDRGFEAATIHGDMGQGAREASLKRFRKNQVNVLVCTDVAARGIDVSGVTHVVNYECPDDAETYVHRIGRTGRAGAAGVAVTFVDWRDVTKWKVINRALDLSFAEPIEAYSTTAELLADLGIPENIKGRTAPPKPKEPKPERSDTDGQRTRVRGERTQRAQERDSKGGRSQPREQSRREQPQPEQEQSQSQQPIAVTERQPKRRNRHRTRNGQQLARPAE